MTTTVAEPEILAEDAAPVETVTAAVLTPEGAEQGIVEPPQPQEAVMIPLAALIAHPGNVRKDLDLNAAFVASIKAEGIIDPLKITASATPGVYRVLEGHRRMGGAIKAALAAVPCFFSADRAQDEAGQYLDQLMTSRHKKLLTPQEEANALFAAHEAGAPKARLAGAYGGKAKEVNQALRAATLPAETQEAAAKAAAVIEFQWSVPELAALAEFSDDAEATARLIEAFSDDQFDWQMERERQERAEKAAREEIREQHKAAGVALYEFDDAPAGLVRLATMPTTAGRGIEPEVHAECPGHLAVFERYGAPRVFYACRDSKICKHIDRETFTPPVVAPPLGSAEQVAEAARKKAEESAQRKRVIEGNKDWRAARAVRMKWLGSLMARTALSAEHTAAITRFTAFNLLRGWSAAQDGVLSGHGELVAELLGQPKAPSDWAKLTAKASAKRLVLLTFLPLVAGFEKNMSDGRWRTDGNQGYRHERKQAAEWLKLLVALGYKLSPIEQAVMEDRPYDPAASALAVADTLNEDDSDDRAEDEPDDDAEAQDDPETGQSESQDESGSDEDDPDPDGEDADEV